jgi:hypothetical protein
MFRDFVFFCFAGARMDIDWTTKRGRDAQHDKQRDENSETGTHTEELQKASGAGMLYLSSGSWHPRLLLSRARANGSVQTPLSLASDSRLHCFDGGTRSPHQTGKGKN